MGSVLMTAARAENDSLVIWKKETKQFSDIEKIYHKLLLFFFHLID